MTQLGFDLPPAPPAPAASPPPPDETGALECSALDRAFARMLVRRAAPLQAAARPAAHTLAGLGADARGQDPLLYHTALLVSAERAQGNSCLELAPYAGSARREHESLPPFTFPSLEEWVAGLRASGVCEEPGTHGDPLERAPLVLDGGRLYLARYHAAEVRVARAVQARLAVVDERPIPEPLFAALFPAGAGDGQGAAARAALRSPLVFITGGPGTGKTTIAARVLALLLEREPSLRIALAAPTGRAAARLGESMTAAVMRDALPPTIADRLPRRGVTLHRLLGYRAWEDRFTYGAAQPLAEDVIVLDEASMVDLLLMDTLLSALRPGARLIVLGDPDQLASVDTGFVLGDIVQAAQRPERAPALADVTVRLTTSYRFGARPGIGALATAARDGDVAAFLAAVEDGRRADVRHLVHDPRRGIAPLLQPIMAPIETYLASTTPETALAALATFRVLCALRDTDAGVTGLNAAVERWLRRRDIETHGWYPHRPILITQNDPATGLYNGDVGTTLVHDGVPMVYFPGPNGPRAIAPARLPAHETAWAMTVHKAQGSEFDHVVMVLPESDARVLTRELLYTGITRARESVTVTGSVPLLRAALARRVARASGLTARLTAG